MCRNLMFLQYTGKKVQKVITSASIEEVDYDQHQKGPIFTVMRADMSLKMAIMKQHSNCILHSKHTHTYTQYKKQACQQEGTKQILY